MQIRFCKTSQEYAAFFLFALDFALFVGAENRFVKNLTFKVLT